MSVRDGAGPLIDARDLRVEFRNRGTVARALDGVSLDWRRRRDPRRRRRVGLRQVDARPDAARPAAGRRAARSRSTAPRSTASASAGELRRRVQMIFQDPYQTLNPRQRVGEIVAEPLVVQGVAKGEHAERVQRALDDVGLEPERFLRPLPAPALGRPAPAGRDRRRAGARARRADLRRAGLDARRLGPHADPRGAGRAAAQPRARAAVHHPRPQPRLVAVRPDRGHVPRADRRAGHARST